MSLLYAVYKRGEQASQEGYFRTVRLIKIGGANGKI